MPTCAAAPIRSWIDTDPPPLRLMGHRFGYGPDEGDMLAEIKTAADVPPQVTAADALAFHVAFNAGVGSDRSLWLNAAQDYRRAALRRRIALALAAQSGFGERLFGFWTDHFTTVPRSPHYMPLQASLTDEAIRPHLGGRFAEMLKAVTLHPMMLTYLDQTASSGDTSPYAQHTPGAGLNENLARELLELHTLGVSGPYTQSDVHEAANLLAGMVYRIYNRGFFYDVSRAEPGVETVLGVDYPADSVAEIQRMLDDLAMHPATARHLARKLAVHFIADQPSAALIDLMASAYLDSGGTLMAVYEIMARALVNRVPLRQKIRQPLEWIIAAFRALGITAAELESLPGDLFDKHVLDALTTLGQPFEQAPDPSGWPEEEGAWIGPQALVIRLTWARSAPQAILAALGRELPDPASLIADYFPFPSDTLTLWSSRAETRQAGIASVLCSPEFLRR